MKKLLAISLLVCAATSGFTQEEEPGHMHGPDGRHIVTEQPKQEASSIILSHHDLRIEGPDGKSVIGAEVNSTISRSTAPTKPVHTEKNAYEPENEVYGSHMTYTEPGEYLISQDVKLPDGKQVKVDFPVFVPPPAEAMGEAEHDHHGPNYLLIIGGLIAGGAALFAAYKFGKKNASQGVGLFVIATLSTSLLPVQSFAQEDEAGHAHGPDGRHIVTQAQVEQAVGPQLRA
ncbi:MAG TPA: hypothetical protein VK171_16235, partial [Fimbriimonas sp.]|nr:hypothetical protein [Fimbriimonas sp.]